MLGVKLLSRPAFSALRAWGEPTAERTTVKLISRETKVSPDHTHLIRQITHRQAAASADLPVNAQDEHSCFLSFLIQLNGPRSLNSPGWRSDLRGPGPAHPRPGARPPRLAAGMDWKPPQPRSSLGGDEKPPMRFRKERRLSS